MQLLAQSKLLAWIGLGIGLYALTMTSPAWSAVPASNPMSSVANQAMIPADVQAALKQNPSLATTIPPDVQAALQTNTKGSNPALNNPEVQANLQALLSQNPALAAQVQQTLAGANEDQGTQGAAGAMAGQSAASANSASPQPGNTTGNQASSVNDPWQPQDPTTAALRDQAFQSVTNQAFPLTPDQIKALNNMLDDTQRAQAAAPYDAPPMPTSTSLVVDLDPGATPPVIRLSKGFVSSLVFVDSTGAPWPIEAYDLGNPSAFNIKWDTKSNTLMVQATATYTYGNLAVKLQNLNTPVTLTLVPGQKEIDYRVDLRIQGMGPNAKPTIGGSGLPGQADQRLLDILDGIAPPNSKQLTVEGGLADAWLLNGTLFVRTRFDLISPGWLSKMSSADGTNAYKLQPTPLLLISRYGKVVSLKVQGL